jgi:hypothetical protein
MSEMAVALGPLQPRPLRESPSGPIPDAVPGGRRGRPFGFTLRPASRLRYTQTYLYRGLSSAGSRIFHNHILRSRINLQFTRRTLSLRTILDYNSVLPNESLVDLERSKRITADVLLTYLASPGTAVYLGYVGRYENLGILPGREPVFRRTDSSVVPMARQVFVKFSRSGDSDAACAARYFSPVPRSVSK